MLRTVTATRYVLPLREGGSVPAILEADDDGMYVTKFRGAAQGTRALVAELISGELARVLGLPMPELVFIDLDPRLARSEPDPEIRDLLKASGGRNLALDYLPRSAMFDPIADPAPPARLASEIVWFDAFVTNVDRTAKNPNLLFWHGSVWLIDHGASLYFHHGWGDPKEQSQTPFRMVKDHLLLPWAKELQEVDAPLRAKLSAPGVVKKIVEQVPDEWLPQETAVGGPAEQKLAYVEYFERRLAASNIFLEEAERARAALV